MHWHHFEEKRMCNNISKTIGIISTEYLVKLICIYNNKLLAICFSRNTTRRKKSPPKPSCIEKYVWNNAACIHFCIRCSKSQSGSDNFCLAFEKRSNYMYSNMLYFRNQGNFIFDPRHRDDSKTYPPFAYIVGLWVNIPWAITLFSIIFFTIESICVMHIMLKIPQRQAIFMLSYIYFSI